MFLGYQLRRTIKKVTYAALISTCALGSFTVMADDYNYDYNDNSNDSYNDGGGVSNNDGYLWSDNWSLTLGGSFFSHLRYNDDSNSEFKFSPTLLLNLDGSQARFSSHNDNLSVGLVSAGPLNAGVVGKVIWRRDGNTSYDLQGVKSVKLGAEAGLFVDVYPVDGLRARAEVRHGIRSHNGVVADLAVDAFYDVRPTIRFSAGPRMVIGSKQYYQAYYGVDKIHASRSKLRPYDAEGGVGSVGVGGAVTWKVTDAITASLFGEYNRLMGPVGDSSIVKQRGSKNQFTVGVSASYHFDLK